jgi:hypothetical protein
MTSPSTANSTDSGETVRPVAEEGAMGRNATRTVVKGEVAPRLPHERDESPDGGSGEPTEFMRKAADDLDRGQADEPRGPEVQRRYTELTEQSGKETKPG